jgi:RimJ/RimL family protein N-acetyltransferase
MRPALAKLPQELEGHGILLRRWRVGDAEILARAVTESVDHLRPWMAWVAREPLDIEQRRAMLRRSELSWAEGGDVMLGVFKDGQVAGSSGLHRRLGPGGVEIGYWIHPRFTRQGLATMAARLLTDAAFSVPDIDRVEIHHDKANVASAGVPRKLGFALVDERPDPIDAPGEIGVECIWRLMRRDWPG